MREYESIFVLDPEVGEERVDQEVDKIRTVVTAGDGEVTDVQKWGRRKLAYEIKKCKEGIYTLVRFTGASKELDEINRQYRLNEDLLRHLTVVYEGPMPGEGEGEGEGEGMATEGSGEAAPAAPAAAAGPTLVPAPETPAAAAPDPAETPAVEPAAESAIEPATEPATEPTAEPVTEPTAESAGEPATESAGDPDDDNPKVD